MKKLALSLVLTLSVTSCATYISGKVQDIKLTSNPDNADCSYNNEVSGGNIKTPGVMSVERSKKTLTVTCTMEGIGTGTENIEPGANYWLLANITNFGLGYFYDVYDGSSWDYPSKVHVTLQPTGGVHEGDFMMKGYANPGVQPRANIPEVQQQGTYAPATTQQQVQQPVSQQQLMQEMMQTREMITSDQEPTYTPPNFDQAPQPQQYQQVPQQYQQVQPQQQYQQAPAQYQPTPYEIFKKQQQQQQTPQQYQQVPQQQYQQPQKQWYKQ